jgi:hypothetical protein
MRLSRWIEGGSTMWSLFTSLELRLIHVRPGVEHALLFFYFFSVVNEPFDGCQMQEEYMISFCVMRLLSLSSIARVQKRS